MQNHVEAKSFSIGSDCNLPRLDLVTMLVISKSRERKHGFPEKCLKWVESTVYSIWSLLLNIQIEIRKDHTTNFLLVSCINQCSFFSVSTSVLSLLHQRDKERKSIFLNSAQRKSSRRRKHDQTLTKSFEDNCTGFFGYIYGRISASCIVLSLRIHDTCLASGFFLFLLIAMLLMTFPKGQYINSTVNDRNQLTFDFFCHYHHLMRNESKVIHDIFTQLHSARLLLFLKVKSSNNLNFIFSRGL